MVIKGIGVLSCGKICSVLYGLFGLLTGSLFSLAALFAASQPQQQSFFFAVLFGKASILTLPIAYALGGLVSGVIFAIVYNTVAELTGGLELECE